MYHLEPGHGQSSPAHFQLCPVATLVLAKFDSLMVLVSGSTKCYIISCDSCKNTGFFVLQTCNQLEVLGGPVSRKGFFGDGDSQTMSEICFCYLLQYHCQEPVCWGQWWCWAEPNFLLAHFKSHLKLKIEQCSQLKFLIEMTNIASEFSLPVSYFTPLFDLAICHLSDFCDIYSGIYSGKY